MRRGGLNKERRAEQGEPSYVPDPVSRGRGQGSRRRRLSAPAQRCTTTRKGPEGGGR
jgi:hypothetical protein